MLSIPTLCSNNLCDWFNDQLVAINEVVEADKKEDTVVGKVHFNSVCYFPVN